MRSEASLLAALQYADSFFPSGALAFSWGLEALVADRQVTGAAELEAFLEGQLRFRWASFDRPFLVAAHRAGGDFDRLVELDRLAAAMCLPRENREAASRLGLALLGVHERLATPGAARYRALIRANEAPGQLPVVQGCLLRAVGLDEATAGAVSAHSLATMLASAALRLGAISHVEAQRALGAMRPILAGLLEQPPIEVERAHGFAPAADIAAMRHEIQVTRLFAN
jgi:urease accessory protein